MRITSSSEYGTRIMVQLGRSYPKAVHSAEALSEMENIPRDYVDQILMRLRRAGLIQSFRGASGGYALARSADKISMGDIFRSVEGEIFEDTCQKYSKGELKCRHQDGCNIRPVWMKLAEMVEGYLDTIYLAQLIEEEKALLKISPQ
ncbi:MAG: Rrf2 family transcriptional regulator [Elusimicrobia bacterium]|nr:Rrf2 family transcriptional regulator [Elusimicrobiota bacterium]